MSLIGGVSLLEYATLTCSSVNYSLIPTMPDGGKPPRAESGDQGVAGEDGRDGNDADMTGFRTRKGV